VAAATGEPLSATGIQHVILDRDGVLNRERESGWLASPEEWIWETGSLEAVQVLARAGIRLSIVSNQSGIGRGLVAQTAVDGIHRWLEHELAAAGVVLVGIFVCPHAPDEGCDCRKPEPGLVRQAMAASGIGAQQTLLVGDDLRDLEAGRTAGVAVALVRTGKGSRVEDQTGPDTLIFDDLRAAAAFVADRTPLSLADT